MSPFLKKTSFTLAAFTLLYAGNMIAAPISHAGLGDKIKDAWECITDPTGGDCGPIGGELPYCNPPEECGVEKGVIQTGNEINGPATTTDARALILGWIQFILSFMFLIAVVTIVVAGIMLIISFGNDGRRQKAVKIILYTILGLLLIMFAYAIVSTLIRVVGG